jgi:hypothetical protein
MFPEKPLPSYSSPNETDSTDGIDETPPPPMITPATKSTRSVNQPKRFRYHSPDSSHDDSSSTTVVAVPSFSVKVDYSNPTDNVTGILPMFPGYSRLYADKHFIAVFHQHLIGKIEVWREKVLEVLDDIKNSRDHDDVSKRHAIMLWAECDVVDAGKGIDAERFLCVGVMNHKVMMKVVKGIKTVEMATLVFNMVFCKSFELTVDYYPDGSGSGFDLHTVFDGDVEQKFAFGDPYKN